MKDAVSIPRRFLFDLKRVSVADPLSSGGAAVCVSRCPQTDIETVDELATSSQEDGGSHLCRYDVDDVNERLLDGVTCPELPITVQ